MRTGILSLIAEYSIGSHLKSTSGNFAFNAVMKAPFSTFPVASGMPVTRSVTLGTCSGSGLARARVVDTARRRQTMREILRLIRFPFLRERRDRGIVPWRYRVVNEMLCLRVSV